MFSKNKTNVISVDTLIGKNTTFEGNIKLGGIIRIDGKVKGEISSTGDVIIGEDAKVIGNIMCNNIIISGIVEGNITAKEQLRLTSTAKLSGDTSMNCFITDEGAQVNGKCIMVDKKSSPSSKSNTKNNK